ncbi:MFS transporter [Patescibacteria group bacterium]|nr:MFS transporter [Patescibacteria group bacterium]
MYFRSIVRSIGHYKINIIIKILIASDFIFWSSYQLFAPFFAIFVTDKIAGGGIETIGIAAALYLICKSLFEIPVGMYIDRSKSEKDDLFSAFLGTFLIGILYLGYLFITSVWELYLLQVLMGIAAAISYPGWCAIFTRHIDKGKEGFEWSLYDILSGIGMAGAAALGGFIIESFGFNSLFVLISIISIFSSFLLLLIKNQLYKK